MLLREDQRCPYVLTARSASGQLNHDGFEPPSWLSLEPQSSRIDLGGVGTLDGNAHVSGFGGDSEVTDEMGELAREPLLLSSKVVIGSVSIPLAIILHASRSA